MWTIADLFFNNKLVPFEIWKKRGARESDRLLWLGIVRQVKLRQTNIGKLNPNPCGVILHSKSIDIEALSQRHIKEILKDMKYNSLTNIKYQAKYMTLLGPISEDEWKMIFMTVRLIPVENKMKDLQYKILMRFVATNLLLYKMKKVNSQNFTFCRIAPESISHLFFECFDIKNIWMYVFEKYHSLTSNNMNCNLKLCLLGMYEKEDVNKDDWIVVNTLIVLVKAYIMACKYSKDTVCISNLIQYLKSKCDMLSSLNAKVYNSIARMIQS